MPLDDDARLEFRELIPRPDTWYFSVRAERILLQAQLPPRPDYRSCTGSTGALATTSEFAERDWGDGAVERRARDTERKRRKRADEVTQRRWDGS
jgi:hypothetical protein